MVYGYEDLNDHVQLCADLLIQTALGRNEELGSSPALSRMKIRVEHSNTVRLRTPPEELILDVDASDIPLHGKAKPCGIRRVARNASLEKIVRDWEGNISGESL